MNQPTPAIVAQNAVRRLPRAALLLLCVAYILPGLLGRGPWRNSDVAAFGYMEALAQGGGGIARWLDPLLLGLRPETPALLPYWLGAWAIQLMPWLRPDLAVRIVFGLLLWGTFSATWYAVYYLARTARAQPVAFAFGGEARPTDYARAMADGGLLALIACLGLAQLGHETTPALAQLFFTSCFFYGVAALPYRQLRPLVMLTLGLLGLSLSGAPSMGLLLGLGALTLSALDRRDSLRSRPTYGEAPPTYSRQALAGIGLATLAALALALALGQMHWRISVPGMGPGESAWNEWRTQFKLFVWFTWPAWPLALWTLWRWRRQLGARHVALPLLFALVASLTTLFTDFSDRSLLLGLPALATLAAFALPTFRRSAAALIDWFTLLFFTGSALLLWLYWAAMHTGSPQRMAASVARLAPGYVPEFSLPAVVIALMFTAVWCWLVRWRTGRHRAALWKTLVLPAGGVTLCWALMMTLWLSPLDYVLSYASQVRALQQVTGQPACVAELGIGQPQLAALQHHGRYKIRTLNSHSDCPWLIVKPEAVTVLRQIVDMNQWELAGTFRRTINAGDDLVLYQRVTPATPFVGPAF